MCLYWVVRDWGMARQWSVWVLGTIGVLPPLAIDPPTAKRAVPRLQRGLHLSEEVLSNLYTTGLEPSHQRVSKSHPGKQPTAQSRPSRHPSPQLPTIPPLTSHQPGFHPLFLQHRTQRPVEVGQQLPFNFQGFFTPESLLILAILYFIKVWQTSEMPI